MRILILSNFYPPSRSWGYTQLCHEVCQHLAARGHSLAILTSNYQANQVDQETEPVFRRLHLDSDPYHYRPLNFFTRRRRMERQNRRTLMRVTGQFRPDVLFVWGMWNMSKAITAEAEALDNVKVVYYISDHWPVLESPHDMYWRLPARRWYMRPVRQLVNQAAQTLLALEQRPPALRFEHAICASKALRDSLVEKGAPVHNATIINQGIDVQAFVNPQSEAKTRRPHSEPLRLLYAGRLSFDKGVHTAINALARLVHGEGVTNVRLTVVGDGAADYVQSLVKLVARCRLSDYVTFQETVSRQEMPALLGQYDVLIFPSIAAEALPRMPQEAMACGLVVVGTTTGGTGELLVEGETGLTFDPEDDETLAAQLLRLATDVDLRQHLAQAGRQTVLEKFTIDRMVNEIEKYLLQKM